MNSYRLLLMEKFKEHIGHSFNNWCTENTLSSSEDRFLTYLIDRELIPATCIQKFTVLQEFERLGSEKNYQKTQLVSLLACKFNLSEKTIWNILKSTASARKKNKDVRI